MCLKCGRYLTAHGDTCGSQPITHIEGKYVTTRDLPDVGILIRVFMREQHYAFAERGDNTYQVKATVKKHEEYKGTKQTIVTRVTVVKEVEL